MTDPLSASRRDPTHTDMLLPGVAEDEQEEDTHLLQSSMTHQTASHMLQESMSDTDPSIMCVPVSHSQTSGISGMQLIPADCGPVLPCNMPDSQSDLTQIHDSSQLQYIPSNPDPSIEQTSQIQSELHVSNQAVYSNLQDVVKPSASVSNSEDSSRNLQPTYVTTTVPVASLHPPFHQADAKTNGGTYNSAQTNVVPPVQTLLKTIPVTSNFLQQMTALNFPVHIIAALANITNPPLVQSQNQPQKSNTLNQAAKLVPIAPAPAPAAGLNPSVPKLSSANMPWDTSVNRISLPSLQRILPTPQKCPNLESSTVANAETASQIPVPITLSGTPILSTSSSVGTPMGQSVLNQMPSSTENSVTFTASEFLHRPLSHPVAVPVGLPHPSLMPSAVGISGQGQVSLPSEVFSSQTVTSMAVSGIPAVQSDTVRNSVDLTSSQTGARVSSSIPSHLLSQSSSSADTSSSNASVHYPVTVPVMSTQETPSLAQGDLQSLQNCLSHPFIQSLSQQTLNSIGSQTLLPPGQASDPYSQLPELTQTSHDSQGVCPLTETNEANLGASSTSLQESISLNDSNRASDTCPVTSGGLPQIVQLPNHYATSGVLSNVAMSSSDAMAQNLMTRLYLTSPMTVVPMGQEDQVKNKGDNQTPNMGETSGAALALSNMSVFDMLLKPPNDLSEIERATVPSNEAQPHAPVMPPDRVPKLVGSYCVECNNSYTDGCKYHQAEYVYVADKPIPPQATLTLPSCFILQKSGIKITSETVSELGVYAFERIPKKTEFGPLIGRVISEDRHQYTSSFTWKIFYSDQHDVIDTSDPSECNWLMYVKPARIQDDQNTVVYQTGEQLFFVTCKDIEPGCEMLFWFAKDYAKLLGLPAKPRNLWPSNCPFCDLCKKVFSDWKTLTKHMKSAHPNSSMRKWPCQMCNRRFTTSTKLKTHMVALHMKLKPYTCTDCNKSFADQSNLRQHIKIHSGERKFKCQTCGKMFTQKAHLQSHMLVHTSGPGFRCQFCDKVIQRASDLKLHELSHTKEKLYPCALCCKVFYKLCYYKKHMRVHSAKRDFKCGMCGKSFFSRYHLTRHLKSCKSAKLEHRGLAVGDSDNLYSSLEQDTQVGMDIAQGGDNSMLNTTSNVSGRLRIQKQN